MRQVTPEDRQFIADALFIAQLFNQDTPRTDAQREDLRKQCFVQALAMSDAQIVAWKNRLEATWKRSQTEWLDALAHMDAPSTTSNWIEHEIRGMALEMETDGTVWIDNPERTESVTIWGHELVALAEFLQRPDVADRLATVRAGLPPF